MARNNSSLKTAQTVKNDEFYTQISDIEQEIGNYCNHLKDKIIYMPCDNPEWSNFWHVLKEQYIYLRYKKIIATFYNGIVDTDKQPYKLEYDGVNETKTFLNGDGDFRSEECSNILQESDIVITNPPFSLFRDFVKWVMDADKKFLIIGNQNAITYKEVFPYIKENKILLGYTRPTVFEIPGGEITKKVGGICRWFTNLDIKKRYDTLETGCLYGDNPSKYPTYDYYNAINCDKTNEIPDDYDGAIGVPITFIDKYCPAQFEILDARDYGHTNAQKNKNTYLIKDSYCSIGGKNIYARILIKRKPNDITYLSGVHLITHRYKSPTEAYDTIATGHLYGDDPSKYPTYDNYNAINCDKTNEIPDDYDGLIGVPITFLDKYCPSQFEIIDGIGRYSILDNEATKKEGKYLSMINGEPKYFRLIIKRKPNNITYLSGVHLITHRFKSPTEAYDIE